MSYATSYSPSLPLSLSFSPMLTYIKLKKTHTHAHSWLSFSTFLYSAQNHTYMLNTHAHTHQTEWHVIGHFNVKVTHTHTSQHQFMLKVFLFEMTSHYNGVCVCAWVQSKVRWHNGWSHHGLKQTAAAMTTTTYATGRPEREERRLRSKAGGGGQMKSHILSPCKHQTSAVTSHLLSAFLLQFFVCEERILNQLNWNAWCFSGGRPLTSDRRDQPGLLLWEMTGRISKGWATASPTGRIPNRTLMTEVWSWINIWLWLTKPIKGSIWLNVSQGGEIWWRVSFFFFFLILKGEMVKGERGDNETRS